VDRIRASAPPSTPLQKPEAAAMPKTPEKTDATKQKGASRRLFIIGGVAVGGGLAIGAALQPYSRLPDQRTALARKDETAISAWLRIGTNDIVTVVVPHADMGVGNGTALAQMLAEELDADWSQVRFERAPGELAFANAALGQSYLRGSVEIPAVFAGTAYFVFTKLAEQMRLQITGGSTAIRLTGIDGMRPAGAAAREMLVKAAANAWGVKRDEVTVKNGIISHPSGKRSGFGQFAEAAAAYPINAKPKLKDRSAYSIVGQAKPRLDVPAKVDGSALYSGDVRLPGMVYGAVQISPVPGGALKSANRGNVEQRRGVIKVVETPDSVGVLADSFWRAKEAAAAIEASFEPGPRGAISSTATIDAMKAAVKTDTLDKDHAIGDADKVIATAAKTIEREYTVPYLAHAQMEPVGCVAQFADGKLTIHGAFQDALGAKFYAAESAGLKPEQVTIVHTEMGGAFGRRGSTLNYVDQAIHLARAADGKPVNFMFTREQDLQQDYYRNASAAFMRAGLDAQGKPTAWIHQYAERHDPKESTKIAYGVPAQRASFAKGLNQAQWGAWRSVDHSIHGFFVESFIDELAHEAGQDPLAYRLALLSEKPRHAAVLQKAAEMARWSEKRPAGTALGIALVESFATVVAEVAEVTVGADGGLKVNHVWVAADPGEVINPNGFAQQMESGVIYGLAAALDEEITFENGAVQQTNFTDYPVVRMAESPRIDVAVIESGARTGGAGEPGTPPIAAAVANAIFAATGQRVRDLPFSKTQLVGPARPA
jgi:isoquinoline 1-oxidoreductase subunit beta